MNVFVYRRLRLLPLLVGALCLVTSALSAQAQDSANAIDVGGPVDGAYTLEPASYAVADPHYGLEANADGWHPLTRRAMDRGISGERFLIRFSVTNTAAAPRGFVFAHDLAFLDTLKIQMVSSTGTVLSETLSGTAPFADRQVAFPNLAFRGSIAPLEVQTFTLTIGMDAPRRMTLGLKIWDTHSFEHYKANHQIKFSSVTIILATMAMVWLVFAITMKQLSLFYYSGYLFLLGLTMFLFFGFGYQFLFPEYPGLQEISFQGTMMGAMSCALMFSTTYLALSVHAPWLDRANTAIGILLGIGALFAVLGGSKLITVPLLFASLFVPAWLWITSLFVVRRNPTLSVLLFCLAWTVMGLTCALLVLQVNFDLLPGIWTPSWNYDVITVASTIEVLILTVSVALSIRTLQRERDSAHAAAAVDSLTGLLNRRGFEQMATTALNSEPRGVWCLALMDLDRFKSINDGFGHGAGDRVLMDFAELLRNQARGEDLVCRIGGEEFALLFDARTPAEAGALCERVRSRFATEPSVIDGNRIDHRVSIGVAPLDPRSDAEPLLEHLLRRADEALYRAKRSGRDRVVLCDEQETSDSDVVLELRLGGKAP